jgi:hypothetical protein
MQALKRLDDQARLLERTAKGPSLDAFIANERSASRPTSRDRNHSGSGAPDEPGKR